MYTSAVTDPKTLNHYTSFSAEVYGEANPVAWTDCRHEWFTTGLQVFISELIRTVPIKAGDIFLDMGSGVGQVSLQVAQ